MPTMALEQVGLTNIRKNWFWFLLLGILLIVLGAMAIGRTCFFTKASMVFIGWMMIFAGAAKGSNAFFSGRGWGGFFFELLTGLYQSYVMVFNTRDVPTTDSHWSPDGIYISKISGQQVSGRPAIKAGLTEIFADENTRGNLAVATESIEFISPSVALEHGVATVTYPDKSVDVTGYNSVYVKRDGKWLIDRMTEFELPTELDDSHYQRLKELGWLVGNWTEAQASENKARLALESTIDGVNTTVARIRAELLGAEVDLADSVVRAPADGYVANLSLRPGQVIIPKDTGVVTFVNSEKFAIAATFKQEVIERIKPGDEAELAFDELPGKTIPAKVKNINWGIPQGQVASSGELLDSTPTVHGRFFVQFEIENADDFVLPPGGAGAATIYTDQGRIFVPVRKVFFRWYTWMNYVNTEMDIRGKRE